MAQRISKSLLDGVIAEETEKEEAKRATTELEAIVQVNKEAQRVARETRTDTIRNNLGAKRGSKLEAALALDALLTAYGSGALLEELAAARVAEVVIDATMDAVIVATCIP